MSRENALDQLGPVCFLLSLHLSKITTCLSMFKLLLVTSYHIMPSNVVSAGKVRKEMNFILINSLQLTVPKVRHIVLTKCSVHVSISLKAVTLTQLSRSR